MQIKAAILDQTIDQIENQFLNSPMENLIDSKNKRSRSECLNAASTAEKKGITTRASFLTQLQVRKKKKATHEWLSLEEIEKEPEG